MTDRAEYMRLLARELHKPARKTFERRKVVAYALNEVWSCDLVDLQEWAKENNGYRYILNAVDVFSRYAMSRPLKSKSAKDVLDAFLAIIKTEGRKPRKIWVDKGSEFYNLQFIKWTKSEKIELYSTYSESKSVIVERFNKTLKQNMWRIFSERNNRKWIDILPDLIKEYNNRVHSFLGMTPVEASQKKNEEEVLEIQTDQKKTPKSRPKRSKFHVGDEVRISRVKGTFEQGYLPNWSREQYVITHVLPTDPVTYKIKDYKGESIEGSFYDQELQLVDEKLRGVYLVEEVIKTRKRKDGKKEMLVKWLGYPSSFNSWISEDDEAFDL
jgi:hypothetical protein